MHHEIPLSRLLRARARLRLLPVILGLMILLPLPPAGAAEEIRLDVGLLVFDPGIPGDEAQHGRLGVFPEIRKAEAKYMPVLLRDVLIESGEWGVVRVLPRALASSELLVTGSILRSDGRRLELRVTARDATGEPWLDKVYSGVAGPADYPVPTPGDPYLEVYRQIGSDLSAAGRQKSPAQLAAIREVALMRYATDLAPETFAAYLVGAAEGRYRLVRLPANDDPMLERVLRIREQEYRFIDTVDEQYVTLFENMAPTYNLWRQFGGEQADYREELERRLRTRGKQGRPGSFAALQQTYNAYRQSKMQEQDLDELARGFNNEVAPTEMEASGTVFKLTGSLETQYNDWRDILRRIFALETGLAPAS